MEGQSILVTGGAGFIGSHLVQRLSLGNKVTVLDNLSSGSEGNLADCCDRIAFIKGDIREGFLHSLVAGKDYVFHLAANVNNTRSIQAPLFDMGVNIKGTLNLLEACRNLKIKRLVYSSSAAVYGEAQYLPIDEAHPLNPQSPYAVSKLAAEKYCYAYYRMYGIPITILRYFNVYGARQGNSQYSNVITCFKGKMNKDETVAIFGDGRQTRDFVFVGDVVQANVLAATQEEAVGEVFNIGSGQGTSVNRLVCMLGEILRSSKSDVMYDEPRSGEIKHSWADIRKAKRILGYYPAVALEEGLLL